MTRNDWCPENDGAYRAEMAALYGARRLPNPYPMETEPPLPKIAAGVDSVGEMPARHHHDGIPDGLIEKEDR